MHPRGYSIVDNPAFDASIILPECAGRRLLCSGDFRAGTRIYISAVPDAAVMEVTAEHERRIRDDAASGVAIADLRLEA